MENNNENGNGGGGNRSTKIFLRQLPANVDWDEIEKLAKDFGDVLSCNHSGTAEAPTAIISYKTSEEASEAAEKLDKKEINGVSIKASIYFERGRNNRRSNGGGGGGVGGAGYRFAGPNAIGGIPAGPGGDFMHRPTAAGGNTTAAAGLPLRMVVGARYVGAIIGQGGANIREITRESKARCVVDVNRGLRDQSGNVEKVINVYGNPDSCSKAALKILEVIEKEAAKDPVNQGKTLEPELKLRAHNNLVGRLIGKGGTTIKKIMEETGCVIFVSNINELNAFNMERTITIQGTLENIAQAESKISAKLRQCWEHDVANAPGAVYGAVHPLVPIPPMGAAPIDPYAYPAAVAGAMQPAFVPQVPQVNAVGGRHPPAPIPTIAAAPSASAFPPNAASAVSFTEIVHVWVPNNVVGALIGAKGQHIRNIMRFTGAHIRIESTKTGNESAVAGDASEEKAQQAEGAQQSEQQQPNATASDQASQQKQPQQTDNERRVTVTGTDQQQYKAQFWIFQRLAEHGHHFFDEVRLCTEIQVPSKLVGRIIGKGGQNVRELQRITGAQVKIPEDAATQNEDEDVMVRIVGNFNASQAVQARIRQLIQQFQQQHQAPAQSQQRSVSGDRQRANNRGGLVNHHGEGHE